MKGKFKRIMIVLAVLCIGLCLSFSCSAAVPYTSYNYDSTGNIVKSGDIYEPQDVISGEGMGLGGFTSPADLFVAGDVLYVLDSGNNRIVKQDLTTDTASEIFFTDGGAEVSLAKAAGIYVDAENRIYVADSENGCVWVADTFGTVINKITKPDSQYFDQDLEFLPRRVTGDSVGNIYVQCTGVYEGLVIFNENFAFSGFFGSEKVQTTAELLQSYFWKQLMTSEQKEAMANYVPSEIYSMDMSSENFLYTITPGSIISGLKYKSSADSIRCLNPKGSDVLESFMPPDVKRTFENDNKYLNFIDIVYSESGYINVLDNKQGKVYQFDNNMQLVSAFAGLGSFVGTFSQPCAIECYNDSILVLDSAKNNITVFSLTAMGKTVHTALEAYNNGDYAASLEPWLTVVEENPNFQLAYIGIGNALYNEADYEQAMHYYELARYTEGYSRAYKEYRITAMRDNFVWILVALILIIAAVKTVSMLIKKCKIPVVGKISGSNFGLMLYSAFHPFVGFDRMRSRKIKSYGFTAAVFVMLVLQGVSEQQYMGKSFAIIDSSEINILSVTAVRLAVLLLFVVANWAFSVLMNGKATLADIWVFTCISLVPYIICGFIRVILSHVLVDTEGIFLTIILAIGIILSFALLMIAFSVFHEFEIGRSILLFIITVIGMLLMVVLAFLIYSLAQNVVDFVKTVFSEVVFRLNA